MKPLLSSLHPWDRSVALISIVGIVAVGASALAELTVGGWGFYLGYTLLTAGAILVGLAVLSLVHRLNAPVAQRTWTGVWLPLVALVVSIALAMLAFAVLHRLTAHSG